MSARREGERRKPNREARVRERHPRLGSAILALQDAPQRGVWVIDTKRYKGKLQVAKPLFGKPTLKIAGRDQSTLVDGLTKQVELVSPALADIASDLAVHGCFCFVDTELPLFGTSTINSFSIFGRRGLAKQLNAPGELTADRATFVAAALSE